MALVSCIMPTRGRPEFAAQAVEYFRAQTWPEKELIIIDDEDAPSFAEPPAFAAYERLRTRRTIGQKRNLACSMATGDLICHFDDDDYSAPGRIADQAQRILDTGAGLTGYHRMRFIDELGRWWLFSASSPEHYILGTSMMYTRQFWQAHPFPSHPEHRVGEDNAVVQRAGRELVTADARDLMWARIHGGNTSRKSTDNRDCWERIAA